MKRILPLNYSAPPLPFRNGFFRLRQKSPRTGEPGAETNNTYNLMGTYEKMVTHVRNKKCRPLAPRGVWQRKGESNSRLSPGM